MLVVMKDGIGLSSEGLDYDDLRAKLQQFREAYKHPALKTIAFPIYSATLTDCSKLAGYIEKMIKDLQQVENRRIAVLVDGKTMLFDLKFDPPFFLEATIVR